VKGMGEREIKHKKQRYIKKIIHITGTMLCITERKRSK
jgi:hypothetical protein